ncbi:MAG: penicillin-binding protein 1C [Cellvibrionaceae bacterium]|nr:penicillin-binding protein 1C [Cellvibrionaceae bacterium]
MACAVQKLAPALGRACRKKRVKIGALLLCALLLFHTYPLPQNPRQQALSTVLLDSNGALLAAKIAPDQQWRFPRANQLPAKYIRALLAFEDQYFFYHPGINPFSLLRAAYSNFKAGRVVSGGSTLTMQLARLIRGDPPRNYTNKAIEALLALKLEWHYSKRDILALYAAHAPFGGNTVGFSAASWRYFSQTAVSQHQSGQLTWAEAALLAVLPNSPALIHPGRGRDKLLAKRNRLLKKLFQRGVLTNNQYQLSLLEKLPQKPQALPRFAPHLLDSLIKQHPKRHSFESTLQLERQKPLLALASGQSDRLATRGVNNLAIVVIDNQALNTVAYVGNSTPRGNSKQYAQHVDIATRPRSTGSVLKPLLYALMLQEGLLLSETLIPDVPVNFAGFTPENFDRDYHGAVSAKQALAASRNIPAVNMLKQYGIEKFYDKLQAMGLSSLFRSPQDYGLSLILGGAEGSLVELTQINALLTHIARNGNGAVRVRQLTSNAVADNRAAFPINQGAAWLTLDALLAVARPGNENIWREFSSSQHVAWKTGTSYGLRDAWAIGNSGKYTVGVWAGNASGEGIAGLSGLSTAAPIMFNVFNLLGNAQWIEQPEFALKTVEVCEIDGFLPRGDCETTTTRAPLDSHFQQTSPFFQRIHLDRSRHFRVHGGCEQVSKMHSEYRFVLPPHQAYYWQQNHSQYQALPPWRADCIASLANYTRDMPMQIIYPQSAAKIYIPIELSGKKGRVVFKASHRNPQAKIHWHLNQKFIQSTQHFHHIALDLSSGQHQLVLIDASGNRLQRRFSVMEKN